jgi:hypothetical protein
MPALTSILPKLDACFHWAWLSGQKVARETSASYIRGQRHVSSSATITQQLLPHWFTRQAFFNLSPSNRSKKIHLYWSTKSGPTDHSCGFHSTVRLFEDYPNECARHDQPGSGRRVARCPSNEQPLVIWMSASCSLGWWLCFVYPLWVSYFLSSPSIENCPGQSYFQPGLKFCEDRLEAEKHLFAPELAKQTGTLRGALCCSLRRLHKQRSLRSLSFDSLFPVASTQKQRHFNLWPLIHCSFLQNYHNEQI